MISLKLHLCSLIIIRFSFFMPGVWQYGQIPLLINKYRNIMLYLTVEEIKKQCNIDAQFEEDDQFLEMIGDAAEDMTAQLLDVSLDELVAENGDLPASIRHAMRILCDYFYSVNRGSSDSTPDIPNAVHLMLKLYRNYK